jgi:hypothetical protein
MLIRFGRVKVPHELCSRTMQTYRWRHDDANYFTANLHLFRWRIWVLVSWGRRWQNWETT